MLDFNKQFLIIGNQNAITYKEVFPLLRDDKVWLGYDIVKQFIVNVSDPLKLNKNVEWDAEQNCYIAKFGNICWFTNLEHDKRNEEIILYKKYNKEEYPTYDNYNAINVNKIKDIPCNYKGIMGVPITFIDKYIPKQFEILGIGNTTDYFTPTKKYINPKEYKSSGKIVSGASINNVHTLRSEIKPTKGSYFTADGIDYYIVVPYARLFIRNRKPQLD